MSQKTEAQKTSESRKRPVAHCEQGDLEGIAENGVEAYLDVPYGAYAGMFRECAAPAPWEGSRDCSMRAPVFPQTVHRIEARSEGEGGPTVLIEQNVDAFRMSIWTPSRTGKRPVVMWIHGGGFSSGGCSMPHYDGSLVARDADVVFAGVNYRLGAMGNMPFPGSPDNLALRDLLAAFGWLRANAASFGGDPDDIVLAGQSAGAWFVVALASTGCIDGLFSRMLIMSCPGMQPISIDEIERLSAAFRHRLGAAGPPDVAKADPRKIVAAQREATKEVGKSGLGFIPYEDGSLIAGDIFSKAMELCGDRVPLMAGLTADESSFFIKGMADEIRDMSEEELSVLLDGFCSESLGLDPRATAAAATAGLDGALREGDAYWIAVRVHTEALFANMTRKLVSAFSRSWLYEFDFHGDNGDLGAAHCIDLPFMFGDLRSWKGDPITSGMDAEATRRMMAEFRPAILAFLRSGNPNEPDSVCWPRYRDGGAKLFK